MLNKLLNIASLNNLGKKGQITTLLILAMVAVLIFVLVTANFGYNAVIVTGLTNAVDAGALLLGSQLATRSRVYYEMLGSRVEKCKGGNFWGNFIKFILKVVIGAVVGWALGPLGSIWGAVIGGATALAGATYSQSVINKMNAEAFKDAAAQLSMVAEPDRPREAVFLTVLSQIITDPAEVQDLLDLDGDGDYTEATPYFQYWWHYRMREFAEATVVLLSAVSDFINGSLANFADVAVTGEESFLAFMSREESEGSDGLLVELLRALEEGAGYDIAFWMPGPEDLSGGCDWDDEECEPEQPPEYDELDYAYTELEGFLGFLDGIDGFTATELSASFFWTNFLYDANDTENEVMDFHEFLTEFITYLTAWEEELSGIRDSLADSTISYTSSGGVVIDNPFTKIDASRQDMFSSAIANAQYFLNTAMPAGITTLYLSGGIIYYTLSDETTGSYTVGGSGLYIPSGDLDYFTAGVNALDNFVSGIGPYFATIDTDTVDEFGDVFYKIGAFIAEAQIFQAAIYQFFYDLYNICEMSIDLSDWGGENPVTYEWTDSQGEHSVTVEVSDYELAKIGEKESGGFFSKEHCLVLQNYQDVCWVEVGRNDQANKDVGSFGQWSWNPSSEDTLSAKKRAYVYYSFDRVQLATKAKYLEFHPDPIPWPWPPLPWW